MKRGTLSSSFFLRSQTGIYSSQSFFISCREQHFRMHVKVENCEKVTKFDRITINPINNYDILK